jgi:hypothetical protein
VSTQQASLSFSAVAARFGVGGTVASLTGSSAVTVLSVDAERICLGQRLWRDCVTWEELTSALQLLHEYSAPPSPVEFAERLRRYYAGGPEVRTGCTRVPNLCAIVLRELGYL